jgi:hypothetical protein
MKAPCANVAAIGKGAMTPAAKAHKKVEQVKTRRLRAQVTAKKKQYEATRSYY